MLQEFLLEPCWLITGFGEHDTAMAAIPGPKQATILILQKN